MLKTLGISGKNPDGKAYKGTLTGIQSGAGYTFDWDAGTAVSGFGVRADQYVAVGFGGKQCSFVGYDVKSDGTLEGKWGSFGARVFWQRDREEKVAVNSELATNQTNGTNRDGFSIRIRTISVIRG